MNDSKNDLLSSKKIICYISATGTVLCSLTLWLTVFGTAVDSGASYYYVKLSAIYWSIGAFILFLGGFVAMRAKSNLVTAAISVLSWFGISIWAVAFQRFQIPFPFTPIIQEFKINQTQTYRYLFVYLSLLLPLIWGMAASNKLSFKKNISAIISFLDPSK